MPDDLTVQILREIRDGIRSLEATTTARFESLEATTHSRFESLEATTTSRFESLERVMVAGFEVVKEQIDGIRVVAIDRHLDLDKRVRRIQLHLDPDKP